MVKMSFFDMKKFKKNFSMFHSKILCHIPTTKIFGIGGDDVTFIRDVLKYFAYNYTFIYVVRFKFNQIYKNSKQRKN